MSALYDPHRRAKKTLPETVTLCGSTAYPDLIRAAARRYTLAGHLVWAPEPIGRELSDDEAALLDEVHRAKIRRSDLVIVIRKPDGTLGESVAAEAAYAEAVGVETRHI